MKVSLRELNPDLDITIDGHEKWLESIYRFFPAPAGESPPRMRICLHLEKDDNDNVFVNGTLNYRPFVACSRCMRDIPWDINAAINAFYSQPGYSNLNTRDQALSKDTCDQYPLVDGSVDLEELVNDTVHTAMPSRLILYAEDGKSCRICKEDISGDKVFADQSERLTSPFAVLEKLKK